MYLPFQSIAIGGYHTVFLSVKGFVGTAGRANKGQLGNVSSIDSKIPIGVIVPDAIGPEWASNEKLQAVEQSQSILLTWPEAKDNIKVTGYEVSYVSSDNEAKDVELGIVTQYDVTGFNPSSEQLITVKAVDSSGNKSAVPLEYAYKPVGGQTSSTVGSDTESAISESGMDPTASEEGVASDASLSSPFSSSDESTASEPDITGEVPAITPEASDPLAWSPAMYGTIIPLEVPWNVDYIYGKGVVLPPQDYSWLIVILVATAIVSFFLFLGVVSFRKKHRGHRLFKGVFQDIAKRRTVDKAPPSEITDDSIIHIGDGIDLMREEDPDEAEGSARSARQNRQSENNKNKKQHKQDKKDKKDEQEQQNKKDKQDRKDIKDKRDMQDKQDKQEMKDKKDEQEQQNKKDKQDRKDNKDKRDMQDKQDKQEKKDKKDEQEKKDKKGK